MVEKNNKITTFKKFKNIILDMLKGYPAYVYYGKFESVFAENGVKIVDILYNQKFIEILEKNEIEEGKIIENLPPAVIKELKQKGLDIRLYRLTSKGVDLAISLTNLEYSEQMWKFTLAVIALSLLTLMVGIDQLLLTIYQTMHHLT